MDPYAVPSRLPFSKSKLPKRVVLSYLLDYVIIIALAVAFWVLDRVEPFHQHFALQNYTIQYPMAVHERIPIYAAIAVAIFGPAVVIAIYTLVIDGIFSHHKEGGSGRNVYTFWKRVWELNCGILGLLLASGTAFVITQVLKNAVGKPRPDFISRCLPRPGSVDPPVFGLSDDSICTQTDDAIMKDGYRSFPSGHSSSSFAGLFYLTLYLAGKLHLYDTRGFTWKIYIVIVPTLGAALIAASRIEDARHHPFDVLFGSALGILCAWLAYRQYFPPLSEPWRKGRAYPIRTWGSASQAWDGAVQGHGGEGRVANPAYEQYGAGRKTMAAPPLSPEPGENVELTPYPPARELRTEHSPNGGAAGGPRLRTAYAPMDADASSDEDEPSRRPSGTQATPAVVVSDTQYRPYHSAAATEAGEGTSRTGSAGGASGGVSEGKI